MQLPVPHALLDHALEFLLLRSRLFRPDFWNSFTRRNNPTASSSFATVPTPASNTTLFPTTSPNSTKSTHLSSVPSSSSLHLPASLLSPFDLSLLCIAPHVLQNPQSISQSAALQLCLQSYHFFHRLSPSQKRFLTHQAASFSFYSTDTLSTLLHILDVVKRALTANQPVGKATPQKRVISRGNSTELQAFWVRVDELYNADEKALRAAEAGVEAAMEKVEEGVSADAVKAIRAANHRLVEKGLCGARAVERESVTDLVSLQRRWGEHWLRKRVLTILRHLVYSSSFPSNSCQVCHLTRNPSDPSSDALLQCDVCGCEVHPSCLLRPPPTPFRCDKCLFLLSGGHPSFLHCCVCFATHGFLFRCHADQNTPFFCHLLCAACHPGLSFRFDDGCSLLLEELDTFQGEPFLPPPPHKAHYAETAGIPPPPFFPAQGRLVSSTVRVRDKKPEVLPAAWQTAHTPPALALASITAVHPSSRSPLVSSVQFPPVTPSTTPPLCYLCRLPVGTTLHCAHSNCPHVFHLRCLWLTGGSVHVATDNAHDTPPSPLRLLCHEHCGLCFQSLLQTIRTRNAERLPCPTKRSREFRCDCCGFGDCCCACDVPCDWAKQGNQTDLQVLNAIFSTPSTSCNAPQRGARGAWWCCVGCGCTVHALCSGKQEQVPIAVQNGIRCMRCV